MSKKRFRVSLTLFLILFAALIVSTISAADEEALGGQAEEAGKLREALNHYVTALQSAPEGSVKEQQLREKIIKLAHKIQPPPAIPEEATKFSVRGGVAIKEAKSTSDYAEAVREFSKALKIAPWWAETYFNLAVAQEKAGQLDSAIRNLKLYLLAAPNAPDAQQAKNQIYALEYRQEKLQKERLEQRQRLENLAGEWWEDSDPPQRYRVEMKGNTFKLILEGYMYRGQFTRLGGARFGELYIGTIKDFDIVGTYTQAATNPTCWPSKTFPLTGTISKDLNTITIKTQFGAHGYVGSRCGEYHIKDKTINLRRK
jgi:tetratricopeptide (TPR) repeat protein